MPTKTKPKPIPTGFHTVTPYLILRNAAKAIEFYKKAFGALEIGRFPGPDGRIMHAELKIGDSRIMLADEFPEMGAKSPEAYGGSPAMLYLYVDNADAWFDRAVKAGAKIERPLTDQFYGDRSGMITDGFGYQWYLATHKEDVSFEEMQLRAADFAKKK